jgi:hypothetical protein
MKLGDQLSMYYNEEVWGLERGACPFLVSSYGSGSWRRPAVAVRLQAAAAASCCLYGASGSNIRWVAGKFVPPSPFRPTRCPLACPAACSLSAG